MRITNNKKEFLESFDEALRLLRGGYHADDLQLLMPTDEELLEAARWARTHDPSEGYLRGLEWFLREFGYEHLVGRL